ncbi:multidrug effflux MFS transporter [Hahella sp. SMD15-11]|uniref:Bcr/CflA family efflux transporter n=1 Tax=Thermohahella caldifontis TaxID=3142973 RepID=A0AB39UTH8_9GAMM
MTETTSRRGQPALTLAAALLVMLGPFSIDAYLPAFPAIEQHYGVSRALLSQSLAGYLFAYAGGMLIWGPVADHYGRKATVITSLILFALASLLCALAPGFTLFLTGRVLQGLAASGSTVGSRAMIRDAHSATGAQRAMSQVMMVFTLAPVMAPLAGGWLVAHLGWASIFVALVVYSLLLAAGLARWLPETLPRHARQSLAFGKVFATYRGALMLRPFRLLLVTGTCTFAAFFLYIAGAPTVIFDILGLAETDFLWQFGPMVSGMFLGSLVSQRVASRYGPVMAVHLALGISAVAILFNLVQSLLWPPTLPTVIGPLVLMAFAIALLLPGITVQLLDCLPHHRGAAAAVQGFSQMGANALSASLLLPALGAHLTHFALAQIGLLSLALTCWVMHRKLSNSVSPA